MSFKLLETVYVKKHRPRCDKNSRCSLCNGLWSKGEVNRRGQIILVHADGDGKPNGNYMVEFCDADGGTLAVDNFLEYHLTKSVTHQLPNENKK